MKYEMMDVLLCAFPVALIMLQFMHVEVAKKKNFIENYWNLEQTKAIQGLVAAYIILHHMTQMITQYGAIDRGPITIMQGLGIYFVSIFFFFSGYGLLYSYQEKENYMDGFLLKRLSVVLIPFVLTNILYTCTLGFSTGRIQTVPDVITSLLGYTLINENAWYVVEIILLYIVFFLAYRPRKNKAVNEKFAFAIVSIFTILMVAGSLLLCHDDTEIGGHWFKGEWWYNTTILFVVGMAFAAGGKKLRMRLQKYYTVLLIVCTVALAGFFVVEQYVAQLGGYYQEWPGHPGYMEKFETMLVQSVACVAFVIWVLLVMMKCNFKNKVLTFLGVVSFEVYLVHDLFRTYLGGGYFDNPRSKDLMQPFILYTLVLALSYFAAFILHFIDQKIIKVLRAARDNEKTQ